jgi:hypothetical protein
MPPGQHASGTRAHGLAREPAPDGVLSGRLWRRKLKKIQYRPHLIDGCLAGTGLTIEPW